MDHLIRVVVAQPNQVSNFIRPLHYHLSAKEVWKVLGSQVGQELIALLAMLGLSKEQPIALHGIVAMLGDAEETQELEDWLERELEKGKMGAHS